MMEILILCAILSFFSEISAKAPMQCFAILDTTTISQQRTFYEMSFVETANATTTTNMLTCFLKASRYSDDEKSITEKYFDIYKKCCEYQKNTHESIGKKQLNELIQLELQHNLVNYLQAEIKSGIKAYIEESISYIADKMAIKIESSEEYKDYKESILRKINRDTTPTKPQELQTYKEELVKVPAFRRISGQKSNFVGKSIYALPQILCFSNILLAHFIYLC